MTSRLVNVRLDEERLHKVRVLREQGVPLSDVIREAIDERFEQVNRLKKVRDVRDIVQRNLTRNCTKSLSARGHRELQS